MNLHLNTTQDTEINKRVKGRSSLTQNKLKERKWGKLFKTIIPNYDYFHNFALLAIVREDSKPVDDDMTGCGQMSISTGRNFFQ